MRENCKELRGEGEKNLKSVTNEQSIHMSRRTFCIMGRQVNCCSKPKFDLMIKAQRKCIEVTAIRPETERSNYEQVEGVL